MQLAFELFRTIVEEMDAVWSRGWSGVCGLRQLLAAGAAGAEYGGFATDGGGAVEHCADCDKEADGETAAEK